MKYPITIQMWVSIIMCFNFINLIDTVSFEIHNNILIISYNVYFILKKKNRNFYYIKID